MEQVQVIAQLAVIDKLSLKPSDVMVVNISQPLPQIMLASIKQTFENYFKEIGIENKVMVLGSDVKLSILEKDPTDG